jgi:hypothetical protein
VYADNEIVRCNDYTVGGAVQSNGGDKGWISKRDSIMINKSIADINYINIWKYRMRLTDLVKRLSQIIDIKLNHLQYLNCT